MGFGSDPAFWMNHGYAVLFVVVLLQQLGLPLPGAPPLMAAGALAANGQLDFGAALLATFVAGGLSDTFWFELGRLRGARVLRSMCRLSLEPDSCVRRTQDVFARGGPNTLLLAKFLPGLNSVASPLAGMIGMARLRFHVLSGAGTLLWAGTWMAAGWVFCDELDRAVRATMAMSTRVGAGLALAFVLWLAWMWERRRHVLRGLVAGIARRPEALPEARGG
ncbi:MAG TPA: DedA family protein [Vicinamibacteria bacterium]|nr:DedA family protein [Vicinamibacteria bacterium]